MMQEPELMAPGGAAPVDDKQLVASLYSKPDGSFCTEGPDGSIVEHPDLTAALDYLMDQQAGGDNQEQMEPYTDEAQQFQP